MNKIQIPQHPVTLVQAAQLLADAVCPGDPYSVPAWLNLLLNKAHSGEMRGRLSFTLEPLDTAGILPSDYAERAVLTPCDIRRVAAGRGLLVVEDGGNQAAMPQPVEAGNVNTAPVVKTKATPRTWWEISSSYIVQVIKAGQYATCKELYRALEAKAGPNSPFDKGTGDNRGSLFVREIAQPLSVKTVQNRWKNLQELARK